LDALFIFTANYFSLEPKRAIIRIKGMNEMPSPDLLDRIISRINYEHKILLLKRKIFSYATSFFLSLAAFVPLAIRLNHDLAQSDFLQFFSLLFSDFSSVMSNIGDFFWLILESIPAASTSLTLIALTAFVFSVVNMLVCWNEFNDLRQLKVKHLKL
jgi:hypothetical protein